MAMEVELLLCQQSSNQRLACPSLKVDDDLQYMFLERFVEICVMLVPSFRCTVGVLCGSR
jgi:hypothetical protein